MKVQPISGTEPYPITVSRVYRVVSKQLSWKPLKIVTLTLFYIANLIFENITFFRKILKKAPLKITIFSKKFRQYFPF